ncbi:prolyl oligopeptidase family serine peptidase [Colwellia piezophila]|uniref:prolyl oligopeptidase family serine peptidase n=1 Tax=Colwellia piezophila TaxID=211668 RepID=UPI00037976C6|nr:prolyl oligopeptidase family serine peptidase [Colwellia piezophila]
MNILNSFLMLGVTIIGLFIVNNAYSETQVSKEKLDNIISNQSVTKEKDCFRGTFENYHSFKEMLLEKRRKKNLPESEIEKAAQRIDLTYGGENKFNEYKQSLTCRTFIYDVDGVAVQGFVIKPNKAKNEKLPVVVYNRGGNGFFGYQLFGYLYLNHFPIAEQGFVFIGSQYRLKSKINQHNDDEFGGADVEDVSSLLDIIPNIIGADQHRIGMFGVSRGSMQTFLTLKGRNGDKVKAVVSWAGNSDLARGLEIRPEMEKVYFKRIPKYAENKQLELNKRSVLKWVDKLPKAPVLLLHGDADRRVNVEHSVKLASEFERLGYPHKLIIYPGDNHGLRKNSVKAKEEVVSWFKRYL